MKVLFGMPRRQTTGYVQSLAQLVGLDWKVPDCRRFCRRQRSLNVSIPYRGGAGPLHLLIDSTDIKCKCWIKISQKCRRKFPHLTGSGISRAGDWHLHSSVATRAVSGAVAG